MASVLMPEIYPVVSPEGSQLEKEETSQLLLLPVELRLHVLSFILSDNSIDGLERRNALKSLSLVCRSFRELTIPHVFRCFNPGDFESRRKQSAFDPFCAAWMRGESAATALASSVKECVFRHKFNQSSGLHFSMQAQLSMYEKNCDKYMEAFASLPNLSRLTLSQTIVKPALLHELLVATQIDSLWLQDSLVFVTPDGVAGCTHDISKELAEVICTHATALKTLKLTSSPVGYGIISSNTKPRFSLHTLTITNIRDESDIANLGRFLAEMPSLEVLIVKPKYPINPPSPTLSVTDIPRLHTLTCPIDWVPRFVAKSRSIRHLWLGDGLHNKQQLQHFMSMGQFFIDAMRQSGNEIRSLTLPFPLSSMRWGQYTPYLEYLKVIVPGDVREHVNTNRLADTNELSEEVINTVGTGSHPEHEFTWPNLNSFSLRYELHPDRVVVKYAVDVALQRQHINSLLNRFPNISEVELCDYISWNRSSGHWKPVVKGEWKALYEYFVIESRFVTKDDWWREHDYGNILEDILYNRNGCTVS